MQKTRFLVKIKRYSAMEQLASLRATYNPIKWDVRPHGFSCWLNVMPSALSDNYTLKISYDETTFPKVYVVRPNPLKLAEGAQKLPHTYDTHKQQLCLFLPQANQWNSSMLISKTIIHWALEWLYYYEDWAFSGIWRGGGHGVWDAPISNQDNLREK